MRPTVLGVIVLGQRFCPVSAARLEEEHPDFWLYLSGTELQYIAGADEKCGLPALGREKLQPRFWGQRELPVLGSFCLEYSLYHFMEQQ